MMLIYSRSSDGNTFYGDEYTKWRVWQKLAIPQRFIPFSFLEKEPLAQLLTDNMAMALQSAFPLPSFCTWIYSAVTKFSSVGYEWKCFV